MSDTQILELCKKGIERWKQAFNRQDAAACAAQYTQDSVMEARPFGTFKGKPAIQAFWQDIMDKGFADVKYSEVSWEPTGPNGYLLSANWTMNKAFGVVHREHWIVETDGNARLVSDDFEIQGER